MKRISSQFTLILRVAFPLLGILASIVVIVATINLGDSLVVNIAIAILILVFTVWPAAVMNDVVLQENCIEVTGFKEIKRISITDIIELKRFRYNYYRLKVQQNGQRYAIYFPPRFRQVYMRFRGEPESIKYFRKYASQKGIELPR